MADDRGPLERVKDAVAAALGRRSPEPPSTEDIDDPGGLAEPTDFRLGRTAGVAAPPVARRDPPPAADGDDG